MLHALIMAGGGGTRFWPRSRQKKPKQFLTLVGDRTLLQQTFDRIEGLVAGAQTWIVTSADHRAECSRELPEIPSANVVGEPMGRDTAACIGLGAALIARDDPDATMIVMPADHAIEPAQEFRRCVQVGANLVEEHPAALATIGIPPTYPATGYGYIQRGEPLGHSQGIALFRVKQFREKPSFDVAQQFLATGEFYWNSGIFLWKAKTILDALGANQPAIRAAAERIASRWDQTDRDAVLRAQYEKLPKISIDFAVMEKAKEVLTVQASYRWDDVGSWLALERIHPQDADRNTILATHVGIATKDCVIVGDPEMLLTTIGVQNLLIIQDGDVILVADRREEGAVKNLVDLLKKKGLDRYLVRTRILAIDPGKVRLGLAISDPDRRIGSPLSTYTRKSLEADGVFLKRLVEAEAIGLLLVGLPVRMDGHEGEQAKLARVFGQHLEGWTALPVRFWDERYTSLEADTLMTGAGLTRKRRKERRDRVAAQILLQSFLDAGCPSSDEPEA